MAEYLTNDVDLKKVADAIRTKGGTSATLSYPDEYVSAINAITTGTELKIVVSVTSGAVVTATKGSNIVSGTSVNGVCTLVVPEAGTWSVKATLNGQTSDTKSVSFVDSYAVACSFLKDNFADNDWASIIDACHSGNVPDTWVAGNSKPMTIGGVSYQVDIIGKNHDTYVNGGKAPLTFQLHDCYGETRSMNSSNTNNGGWPSCAMRQTHLPAILSLMPTEVQNGIREVNKLTAQTMSGTINTTVDKLFLLSEVEIFGVIKYSNHGEGTQYDYYKAGNSYVKKYKGNAYSWGARSPDSSSSVSFCSAISDGSGSYPYPASTALGVAFGFCF